MIKDMSNAELKVYAEGLVLRRLKELKQILESLDDENVDARERSYRLRDLNRLVEINLIMHKSLTGKAYEEVSIL